jgi:2-methylcitrate dehydratase PrpD
MLAAELAALGFTGPTQILEGRKGFFAAMCDDPAPERILEQADAPWQLGLTSIKPWPSCRHTHPVIDCALEISDMLDGQTPERVEIRTYQAALDVCNNPEPDSEYQAKFSLYHTVAIALLDGAVELNSFTAEARQRSERLRRQTTVTVAHPYVSDYPGAWGAEVTVVTTSGASFKVSRKHCKGDPELALDNDEMRVKALGLLRHGGLDETSATRVCDQILAMPESVAPVPTFSSFITHALTRSN